MCIRDSFQGLSACWPRAASRGPHVGSHIKASWKAAIMPTNVFMPQMGEAIAEGTIVRWVKKIGDHVDRDEPLFEISTDTVDAEIHSPAAGGLNEIRAKEGGSVAGTTVVAIIDESPGAVAPAPAAPATASAPGVSSMIATTVFT